MFVVLKIIFLQLNFIIGNFPLMLNNRVKLILVNVEFAMLSVSKTETTNAGSRVILSIFVYIKYII